VVAAPVVVVVVAAGRVAVVVVAGRVAVVTLPVPTVLRVALFVVPAPVVPERGVVDPVEPRVAPPPPIAAPPPAPLVPEDVAPPAEEPDEDEPLPDEPELLFRRLFWAVASPPGMSCVLPTRDGSRTIWLSETCIRVPLERLRLTVTVTFHNP
jgi:hypothetical protein